VLLTIVVLVSGSHEIETFEMIGRGGYAVVYRGRCRGEEVAVKILQSSNIIQVSSEGIKINSFLFQFFFFRGFT